MKNIVRFLGIIAMVAAIGFLAVSCGYERCEGGCGRATAESTSKNIDYGAVCDSFCDGVGGNYKCGSRVIGEPSPCE